MFLDIEKLKAGKFDDNLLNNVRNARNFILVLSPGCLDRCINDDNNKDWVHRVSYKIESIKIRTRYFMFDMGK